jgi:hypothetical protein
MHEYSIINHDRASIGKWLGIIALVLASIVSDLIGKAYSFTGFELLGKVTVTIAAIYFGLHWLFNNYLWKYLTIPDISGQWDIKGNTLDLEGNTIYEWKGILSIEQKWDKIAIHFKTEQSEGVSYMATLLKKDGANTWSLKYSYANDPHTKFAHALTAHKGCSEIDFLGDLSYGEGFYFNSNERHTFGTIQLKRINK